MKITDSSLNTKPSISDVISAMAEAIGCGLIFVCVYGQWGFYAGLIAFGAGLMWMFR